MSRTWKWILGVLAVLLLVGLIVGAVWMWDYRTFAWGPRQMMFYAPGVPDLQPDQDAPYGNDGYWRYHMQDRAWRMPMMHAGGYPGSYAFGPYGTGFMIVAALIRLAIPLGILALVAYVFYQMGKRAGAPQPASAPRPDIKSLPSRRVARR